MRTIDEKLTKIARVRQQRAADQVQAFFAWDPESARDAWLARRRSFSAAERARRRAHGKVQRLARRRNRA